MQPPLVLKQGERLLAGDSGRRPHSVPATLSYGLMASHVLRSWFMWSWRAGVPSEVSLSLPHHCLGGAGAPSAGWCRVGMAGPQTLFPRGADLVHSAPTVGAAQKWKPWDRVSNPLLGTHPKQSNLWKNKTEVGGRQASIPACLPARHSCSVRRATAGVVSSPQLRGHSRRLTLHPGSWVQVMMGSLGGDFSHQYPRGGAQWFGAICLATSVPRSTRGARQTDTRLSFPRSFGLLGFQL